MFALVSSQRASALRAAALHLLLSVLVVAMIAALVFGIWFPAQLRELSGGLELFWLVVGVDVVCGPLLTLVVFNPAKPPVEMRRDLTIVVAIQLLALVYGLHTLSYARPVALVHEVDRFRIVSYADLDMAEENLVPIWARPWRLSGVRTVGTRPPASVSEKAASIDGSLQGVEPSQRPSWWQEYSLSVSSVLARARPISQLRHQYPAQVVRLNEALARATEDGALPSETSDPDALLWLPLVGRRAADWIVLIDPLTARVRGYVHLDGFF